MGAPGNRFRPHQAHYQSDNRNGGTGHSDDIPLESEWTRHHASKHTIPPGKAAGTKLPYIISPQGSNNTRSPTKGRRDLPSVGMSPRSPKSPNSLMDGSLPQGESLSRGGSRPLTVSDWKNDEGLQTWYKEICQRKKEAKAKQLRQANKDAQWILDRREKQMKEIQKIQKAEQEAEAKSRRMQNYNALNKFQAPSLGNKEAETDTPAATTTYEGVHHHHEQLQWQDIPEPSVRKRVAKDVAIWVKPGVFVTKNVA